MQINPNDYRNDKEIVLAESDKEVLEFLNNAKIPYETSLDYFFQPVLIIKGQDRCKKVIEFVCNSIKRNFEQPILTETFYMHHPVNAELVLLQHEIDDIPQPPVLFSWILGNSEISFAVDVDLKTVFGLRFYVEDKDVNRTIVQQIEEEGEEYLFMIKAVKNV
jgi:hypothetical protein